MAAKKYYTNFDLNGNQLKNTVIENVTQLLDTAKSGQIAFDANDNKIKYHNGTSWQSVVSRFDGQMIYKGKIDSGRSFTMPEMIAGDLYVFSEGGSSKQFGLVKTGDMILFGENQTYSIIQGNTVYAEENVKGMTTLSSDLEILLGNGRNPMGNVSLTVESLKNWAEGTQTNKISTLTRKKVYLNQKIDDKGLKIPFDVSKDFPSVTVYTAEGEKADVVVNVSGGFISFSSKDELIDTKIVVTI